MVDMSYENDTPITATEWYRDLVLKTIQWFRDISKCDFYLEHINEKECLEILKNKYEELLDSPSSRDKVKETLKCELSDFVNQKDAEYRRYIN